jgi:hypothetical protein
MNADNFKYFKYLDPPEHKSLYRGVPGTLICLEICESLPFSLGGGYDRGHYDAYRR